MTIWILASVAGIGSLWITRHLVSSSSMLDYPNERSLHSRPTPRTGGIAAMCGLFASSGIGLILAVTGTDAPFWWVTGPAFFLAVLSFYGDKIGLSPASRFCAHSIAAAVVVWGAGLQIRFVPVPLFADIGLGLLAAPVTFLLMIWITNLYNFMDGMDGFAGGMSVIGFGFLAYFGWLGNHQLVLFLSLLTAASTAGFLIYNFPPAKIFLGDIGSIPLGFLAASLVVLGIRDQLFDVWVGLLVFSPFIVDATITLIKRTARREKLWKAHRKHYYQRLVLAGWTHRKTVLHEYVLMFCAGCAALLYWRITSAGKAAVLFSAVVAYVILGLGVRRVERQSRGPQESVAAVMTTNNS